MMQVQRLLRDLTAAGVAPDAAISCLSAQYAIRTTVHPSDPLVILNYDQIDSPKHEPITQECRALTLELGTWDVVARSFNRFFNAGEAPEQEKTFDWTSFTATSKEDGSLMPLYRYKDTWRVNTRGSFALGEIGQGVNKTWEECFYEAINEVAMDILCGSYTYVFEFCSPYNKVVRKYDRPTLFLLTAFHNQTGFEMDSRILDTTASVLEVQRPANYAFSSLEFLRSWLEQQEAQRSRAWSCGTGTVSASK